MRNMEVSIWSQKLPDNLTSAIDRQVEAVRNDASAKKSENRLVDHQRALLRTWVDGLAANYRHDVAKITPSRMGNLAEALGEGLGLRSHGDMVRNDAVRVDAGRLFSNEARAYGQIAVQPDSIRGVLDNLPTEMVSPRAETYRPRAVSYEGSVALHRPGQNNVPKVNYKADEGGIEGVTLVCEADLDWYAALYGLESDLDPIKEQAAAATEALLDAMEHQLVWGVAPANVAGIKGLAQLTPTLAYQSSLNYRGQATTLGQVYRDFVGWLSQIPEASNFRGSAPNTLGLSPAILSVLGPMNSIDAGGGNSGAELFGAASSDMSPGKALFGAGIRKMWAAPKMSVDPQASDFAMAIAYNDAVRGGLRKLVSLLPAPIRSYPTSGGDTTLFGARHFGVQAEDVTSVGRGKFQVRGS